MGLAASRQEAFWESCGFGHLERARHFLQEGDIDVNWVSYTNDCCPIHVASQGKPDIVQLLLEHKCKVNVRDNRGNLPLHHAAMKGHADIVQTLLDAGCEINAQEKNGWTALHNAAYWCRPEVVRVLLKNGCDVHIQNKDMRTALHECARSQSTEDKKLGDIAQVLTDAGCDINSKSSDWGEADLTGLMYASFHNHPDVASALITAGCELNAVGTTFWTALHWAADRGNDELVYILLDAGIDPTVRDMRGETAVDRAQTDDIREFIATAVDIHKELHRVKKPVIRPAVQLRKQEEPFKPKCDANFKSQSFLPKDWKPSDSVNVKNLINEKKSRLAAMTSQKYRTELAKRTGTDVIKDEDLKKSGENMNLENLQKENSNEKEVNDSETKFDTGKGDTVNDDGSNLAKESLSNAEAEEHALNKVDDFDTPAGDLYGDVEPKEECSVDKESNVDKQTEFSERVEEFDKCNVEIDKEVKTEVNPHEYVEGFDFKGCHSTKTSQVNDQTDGHTSEILEPTDSQKKSDCQISEADENQTSPANEKGDASNSNDIHTAGKKMVLDSEVSAVENAENSSGGFDASKIDTVENNEHFGVAEKQAVEVNENASVSQ